MAPNTADVRKFLTDLFSDEELTTLCFDYFPEVYDNFTSGLSKGQKILALLDYSLRREQFTDLLKILQQARPAQYAKRLGPADSPAPVSSPVPQSPTHTALAPVTSNVSGGVTFEGSQEVSIDGDVVGRDKLIQANTYIERATIIQSGASIPEIKPTVDASRPQPAVDSSRALRVFLCHASSDKPAVRDLYQRLRADGFKPWLDEEDILPGQDWQREIPKAVRTADVVIVCLSRGSINKAGYVQKEIKFALDVAAEQPEGAIFLIPLKLEECDVPEQLSRWQWVNHSDVNSYTRLLRALRTRAEELGLNQSPITMTPSLEVKVFDPSARVVSIPSKKRYLSLSPTGTREESILPDMATFNPNRGFIGGIEFVRVPAGKFLMGSKVDNPLADNSERPQHTVDLPDYWIGKYPVTNDQFARFVTSAKYKFDQSDWQHKANHPVVNVTWHDARAYCAWLNETLHGELKDLVLRLPTEAEWEKAARGEYGNEWPWGNDFDKSKCNSREGGKQDTTPVGAYSPYGDSPYGVADMAGNVWEWCHSIYKAYPYRAGDGRENEQNHAGRVQRGGSFDESEKLVRCACRNTGDNTFRYLNFGFRVVIAQPLPG